MRFISFALVLLLTGHAVAGGLKPDPGVDALCVFDHASKTFTGEILSLPAGCTGQCLIVAANICGTLKDRPKAAMDPSAQRSSSIADTSWQSAVVTSLGQLVGDRARQEVEAWFEDVVRKRLCDLKTGDQLWLPATCKLLGDELGAGQQLASGMVIEAVRSDLPYFVGGLVATITTKLSPQLRPVIDAVPFLLRIGSELASGKNPLQLLSEGARDPVVQKACRSRANPDELTGPCFLVFVGVTIDYYGPIIAKGTAGTLEDLQRLAVKLFASGEYRKEICVAFNDGAECPEGEWGKVPSALHPLVSATVLVSEKKVQQLFAVIRDAGAVEAYLASVAHGSNTSETATEQLAKTLDLLDPLWSDFGKLVWDDKAPRAYTEFRHAFAAGSALARKQYRALALHLVNLAKDSGAKLPEWATRLMPLVVDIVEAEDSADVAAAFNRAAAPIGGWRAKRQKPMLSFTALVGAGGGYELPLDGTMDGRTLKPGWAGGLIAPIGIHGSLAVNTWSIGALISLLDLGQITWSRIGTTDASSTEAGTKPLPDAKLSQVFSPGAYVVVGIGMSPFTFGFGASLAPELREYTFDTSGSMVDQSVSVVRVGAFLAVDVTLLPLL